MSATGRPEREYRSAQHEGTPVSPTGRPEGELLPLGVTARSAKGVPVGVAPLKVLVVGATGSIGRLVVDEAILQGHKVRVLVRDLRRASKLPAGAQRVVDGVRDAPNMPLPQEPERVREDLRRLVALEPHKA